MKDIFNVGINVAPAGENRLLLLKIGDEVQVVGRLFSAENTVQITPKPYVQAAWQLADMILVIDYRFEPDI